jgi:hypothetical protein
VLDAVGGQITATDFSLMRSMDILCLMGPEMAVNLPFIWRAMIGKCWQNGCRPAWFLIVFSCSEKDSWKRAGCGLWTMEMNNSAEDPDYG